MDILKSVADVFYQMTGFVQPSMFRYILVAVIIAAFVLCVVRQLHGGVSGDTQMMAIHRFVRSMAATLSIASLVLCSYVFFRPMDPRWAPTPVSVDIPDVDIPEMPNIPGVGGALDDLAGWFEDSADQVSGSAVDGMAPVFDPLNQVLAYVSAYSLMKEFIAFFLLGSIVACIAWWRLSRASKRNDHERIEALEAENAALWAWANQTAHGQQVEAYPEHSLEPQMHIPYDAELDYIGDSSAYAKSYDEYLEKNKAREVKRRPAPATEHLMVD